MSKPLDGKQHATGRGKPARTEEDRLARFAAVAAAKVNARRRPPTPDTTAERDGAPTARLERLAARAARVKRSA